MSRLALAGLLLWLAPMDLEAQRPTVGGPYAIERKDSVNLYLSVAARDQLDSLVPGLTVRDGAIFRTRVPPPPGAKLSSAGSAYIIRDFNRDQRPDVALLGRVGRDEALVVLLSSEQGYRGERLPLPSAAKASGAEASRAGVHLTDPAKDGFTVITSAGQTEFRLQRETGRWVSK